jgi:hypothetical protein
MMGRSQIEWSVVHCVRRASLRTCSSGSGP